MKKILKDILTAIGGIMFVLGMCSADSECLLFPIVMVLGGLAILYPRAKEFEARKDEAK